SSGLFSVATAARNAPDWSIAAARSILKTSLRDAVQRDMRQTLSFLVENTMRSSGWAQCSLSKLTECASKSKNLVTLFALCRADRLFNPFQYCQRAPNGIALWPARSSRISEWQSYYLPSRRSGDVR